MLIGRQTELSALNQLYRKNAFACVILHGRRRIGKTALVHEFCKNKQTVYFAASEITFKNNLRRLVERASALPVFASDDASQDFDGFAAFLDFIIDRAAANQYVIVLDEFHLLADGDRSVLETLGAYLSERLQATKLFLIMTVSSTIWLNRHCLSDKSPLHGCLTMTLPVPPLDYYDSARLLHGFSLSDKTTLYGVTGGVPAYLEAIDPSKNVRENIIGLFFSPDGKLAEEPPFLLKQELREPGLYSTLLEAAAKGANRLNALAAAVQLEPNACNTYLKPLITLSLIDKQTPLAGSAARKTAYNLCDTMFLFWYRYVLCSRSAICAGDGQDIFDTQVKPDLNDYLSVVFERMALQYLWRKSKRNELPFPITETGRLWENDPADDNAYEASAINKKTHRLLLGKCRYTNGHTGMETVTRMRESGMAIKGYEVSYALFSRMGFTRQVLLNDDILMVDLNDMYM